MRLQSMFGTAIPGVLLSYYPNNYLRHYHHYAELIYNTTQRGNTVHTISQRVNQHPPEHYLCRMDAVGQENTSSVYSCSIANHHANHSHVSMSPCSHQVPYLLTHIHSLPTLPMWDFHTYIQRYSPVLYWYIGATWVYSSVGWVFDFRTLTVSRRQECFLERTSRVQVFAFPSIKESLGSGFQKPIGGWV